MIRQKLANQFLGGPQRGRFRSSLSLLQELPGLWGLETLGFLPDCAQLTAGDRWPTQKKAWGWGPATSSGMLAPALELFNFIPVKFYLYAYFCLNQFQLDFCHVFHKES